MLKEKLMPDRAFFRTMLAITAPIALQNLIGSSLNMVDTVMIGQLGETEIASVGLANQITFLLHLFMFGVSSGSAIFTAQYWGSGDLKNVHRILGLGLTLAAAISGFFMVVSLAIPGVLLRIFSDDPVVIELGADYLRIVSLSFVMMAISFTFSSVMRSIGQPRPPMYISAMALLMNTGLNYLLILGNFGFPALGVRGAAIATLASRIFEWLAMLWLIYGRQHVLAARLRQLLDFNKIYVMKFLRTTIPVVLNESLWAIGVTLYVVVYARMGTHVVASVNIAATIERLSMVFVFGMANATAIMIGNQIGANRLDTAWTYARRFARLAPLGGVLVGLVLVLLSPLFLSFYQVAPAVKAASRAILIVYGVTMPVRVFNLVNIVGILRSGGDTRFALMLDVVGVWLIAVPLAFLGGLVLRLPVEQVVMLIAIEEVFKATLGYFRFRSRKWLNRLVDSPVPGDALPENELEAAQPSDLI